VTLFLGVPTVYVKLLGLPEKAFDWRTVRYCFTAAAIMPEEVARAWHERTGHLLYEGYGLTESSPSASYNHDREYRFGSVGTAIENVDIRVVDEEGRPVAPGEMGEIAIRGPNVMLGIGRGRRKRRRSYAAGGSTREISARWTRRAISRSATA